MDRSGPVISVQRMGGDDPGLCHTKDDKMMPIVSPCGTGHNKLGISLTDTGVI